MTLVMYVKPDCPYCQAAREHFQATNEEVEERDATASEAFRAELLDITDNRGTVPTIVRDGALEQMGFPPGHG
jgi:glutaredoxin